MSLYIQGNKNCYEHIYNYQWSPFSEDLEWDKQNGRKPVEGMKKAQISVKLQLPIIKIIVNDINNNEFFKTNINTKDNWIETTVNDKFFPILSRENLNNTNLNVEGRNILFNNNVLTLDKTLITRKSSKQMINLLNYNIIKVYIEFRDNSYLNTTEFINTTLPKKNGNLIAIQTIDDNILINFEEIEFLMLNQSFTIIFKNERGENIDIDYFYIYIT